MHLLCLPVLTYFVICWLDLVSRAFDLQWRPEYYSASRALFFCMTGYYVVRLVQFFGNGGLQSLATDNLLARLLNW